MKKILTLLILLFIVLSCEKKEDNFSDEMIEELIIEDNGLPSKYGFLNLYVKTNDIKILPTTNDYLFGLYKIHYHKSFKTFKLFLNEVLNNDFIINKKEFKKTYFGDFKLNLNIVNQYTELGLNEFLIKYSEKTSSNRTKLKKTIIKENEYLTVVYLLYKNRYDISRDCYIGNDYIIKREDYFKPSK